MENQVRQLIDDATFDFTMGDHALALEKLTSALKQDPANFDAHHAMAEVHFDQGQYSQAAESAGKALALKDDDVHLHTSLSRIWMELGEKEKAEHHGARARMLGWKSELQNPND